MSLKRIAEMAQVSPATVSRVLNDRPGSASEEVRDRVWAAARSIGYVPDGHAQALRTGARTQAPPRVAMVLARIRSLTDDPFFKELSRAVEVELVRQNGTLTELTYAKDTPPALNAPDGILILGRCSQALLMGLKQVTPNVVGLWRNPLNFDIDEVMCDGEKAAALAVNHLRALGHTKIAYIGDCSYERRYVGYTQTLIAGGLPLNSALILDTNQSEQAGFDAMNKIIEGKEATAVLCANDITAVGALSALKMRRGKARQIAVVSIDNVEAAQNTRPLLTTVNIPRQDMAHMAVSVLIDRIRGAHTEPLRVELPCRLVIRESDRPPTRA